MKPTDDFSIPAQRQQWILNFIAEKGAAKIKELSAYCKVSEATIRRDLDEMAETGQLERTHGGALRSPSTSFERYHSEKMQLMVPEKLRIAQEAAKLVQDGQSVFLDSGTTTLYVAQCLATRKDLTVITNNLEIAYSVMLDPTSTVVITGGIRRKNYSVLVGSMTEDFIEGLFVDLAFLGCDAINSKTGVFNSNFMEIGVKKRIVHCCKKLVLVTDHTKFSHNALAKVCDFSEIDVLITDDGLEAQVQNEMREKVGSLILV